MSNQQINTDLAERLEGLVDAANDIGAEGIWIIRGAKHPRLLYFARETAENDTPINLDFAPGEILVVMRFPQGDGGQAGIEWHPGLGLLDPGPGRETTGG